MSDFTKDLGGPLAASLVAEIILVREAIKADRTFADRAKAQLDELLGEMAARGAVANEMMVSAREIFHVIIEAALEKEVRVENLPVQKNRKSLRRRFLNWLERG